MDHNKIALDEGELTPTFLDQEEQSLFAQAKLGEDAVQFLDSDLGRLLRGFALQRRAEAKETLVSHEADPETESGRKVIREARFRAAVASQFLEFVQEALTTGEVAYESLRQRRDEA